MAGAEFFGLGGTKMEAAGLERVVRAEDVAHMGITEVLLHMPRVYGEYRRLVGALKRQRPDVAVLIDFPDVALNFRLGEGAEEAGSAGGLFRQSAAVGVEAATVAMGAGAGGPDDGDLSV